MRLEILHRGMLRLIAAGMIAGIMLLPSLNNNAQGQDARHAHERNNAYTQTNLVANTSALNPINVDPNMVDAWGMVSSPTSPWWVSDQNSSDATVYMATGAVIPLVVQIPCVVGGTVTMPCPYPGEGKLFEPHAGKLNFFGPTGIVQNAYSSTGAFTVRGSTPASTAAFIFDTLDGLIVAWSPQVNLSQGIVVANRSSSGASYNGLALAALSGHPYLYATNSGTGAKVDVFDSTFTLVNSFAADRDPPAGFVPYGIQLIGNKLYVTYFNARGAGGILDVCELETSATAPRCRRLFASLPSSSQTVLSGDDHMDQDGRGGRRRPSSNQTVLNGPWGLARSPANFGELSNKILVGNVNDGWIHAFNPDTGVFAGTLTLSNGKPFAVPGLWALQFGQGAAANGATNQLFFTAGPAPANDPALLFSEGLFGVIMPAGRSRPGH